MHLACASTLCASLFAILGYTIVFKLNYALFREIDMGLALSRLIARFIGAVDAHLARRQFNRPTLTARHAAYWDSYIGIVPFAHLWLQGGGSCGSSWFAPAHAQCANSQQVGLGPHELLSPGRAGRSRKDHHSVQAEAGRNRDDHPDNRYDRPAQLSCFVCALRGKQLTAS